MTLSQLELRITQKFSEWTSSPRWFTVWVVVYFVWVFGRSFLRKHLHWYSDDTDLIILTGLFSAVPFWVENSLKSSQKEFQELVLTMLDYNTVILNKVSELTIAIKLAEDLAQKRDTIFDAENDALYNLVEKLYNSLGVQEENDSRPVERPEQEDQNNPI